MMYIKLNPTALLSLYSSVGFTLMSNARSGRVGIIICGSPDRLDQLHVGTNVSVPGVLFDC